MIEQPLEQMGGFSPLTGDPLAVWLGEWLAAPFPSPSSIYWSLLARRYPRSHQFFPPR